MTDRFDLHIITLHHSEAYCGYFRRLVFGNSWTFSHIPPCFHAKTPNFPCLFDPRDRALQILDSATGLFNKGTYVINSPIYSPFMH